MDAESLWNARLQLRPKSEKLYEFVVKQLDKNSIPLVKEDELKEGYNIYISSAPFAVSLGKLFKKRFKGEVKTTRSLIATDKRTQRRIYKLTVLLRMPK